MCSFRSLMRVFIGLAKHLSSFRRTTWIPQSSPTARIQLFASTDHSVVIWPCKVSGKHLSFMEDPRHDDVVRIVDKENDQMARLAHRRACRNFTTPFQVVEKISLSDFIDGLYADSGGVVAKILHCLVD